jgi:glycolate oxidase FAD binding subunit
VKICIPPSAVTRIISEVLQFDPNSAIQAHAANGIILARFSKFGHADLTAVLAGKLRPAAAGLGGSLIVVSTTLDGITPHLIWGGRTDAGILLERVKQKFDPRSILNPGRFVY